MNLANESHLLKQQKMSDLVRACKYDVEEMEENENGDFVKKTKQKLDLEKFKKELTHANQTLEIKMNLRESRIKRDTADCLRELKVYNKGNNPMSLLQDKPKKMNHYQKKELEKKQARRRHLQRAKAGIDLSQR